jgi:uncharacterized C2H2 Zn-finger protein
MCKHFLQRRQIFETRSRHQDIRFGRYKFKCSCKECRDKFYTRDALERHAKQHKVADVDKLDCKKCNNVFTKKQNYQRHLETAMKDGEDKYKCVECAISYCTQTILSKHIEVEHSGDQSSTSHHSDRNCS